MVANWCSTAVNGMIPSATISNASRRAARPKAVNDKRVEYLNKFFDDLPKMPSHYCRRDSKKLYLEYNFESKAKLYRVYKEKCLTGQVAPLSTTFFSETFENLGLAIFTPKKDQCNLCVSFKAGNVDAAEYNRHIELKNLARHVKEADKINAIEGLCHAFVMDVQAVKMSPVNNANKFYFKTRLKVHNLTIYDMSTHQCCNYWWNETEGDLSSSVFTTLILNHLEEFCKDDLPVILWSDGCGYQNRNSTLSNALLHHAKKHNKTITQKYLEPGHTQMECDSVHSLIERKLKNKDILIPYDYVRITREARQKPLPFEARYMTHDMFKKYDDKDLIIYQSIRPGRSVNDSNVNNLRVLHYSPNSRIGYKLHFHDEMMELPQRSRDSQNCKDATRLFPARLNITQLKYDHLQEIKSTLDAEPIRSKGKKVIAARTLLPPCNDKCILKCYSKFTEEDRKQIFKEYWGLGDLEKQRQYISASMTVVKPKYRYVREGSHRRPNNAFHFEIRDKKIRSSSNLPYVSLIGVIGKRNLFTGQMLSSDLRGKHGRHAKVDEEIKNGIRQHIMKIPRIESHYCRKNTNREYIEGGKTIAELHRDYKKECTEENKPSGNCMMYCKIFNEEFNLSFFVPKKDQCELCIGYFNGSEEDKISLQAEYDLHRLETDLSRKEKEHDKNSNANIVAVYDLQAVLPCPSGDANSFYYVSKLNVLNLTVCNIKTKDVQCYVWHEGEAQRGVNEIGTCILRYLESLQEDVNKKHVIFYSDNCGGQQKNRFMIAAYMYAVQHFDWLESITHKYLIKGHSQNEGDSAHSLIERQIKRSKTGPVYIPDQYVTLIRSAKKSGQPYKVDELCHKDIFDLKQLASDIGFTSYPKKNTDGDPLKISEIKVLKIMKDSPETILYKTSYQQEEFQTTSLTHRKKNKKVEIKCAYSHKVGITEKKKTGLLALFYKKHKPVPMSYFPFYEAL
nr:unnamed protein product [Callosobruchus chinensis]